METQLAPEDQPFRLQPAPPGMIEEEDDARYPHGIGISRRAGEPLQCVNVQATVAEYFRLKEACRSGGCSIRM